MSSLAKLTVTAIASICIATSAYGLDTKPATATNVSQQSTLSEFYRQLENEEIAFVDVYSDGQILYRLNSDKSLHATHHPRSELRTLLQEMRTSENAEFNYHTTTSDSLSEFICNYWIAIILALLGVGAFVDYYRTEITKRPFLQIKNAPSPTLSDLALNAKLEKSLRDLANFAFSPDRWQSLPARLPKSLLLTGTNGHDRYTVATAIAKTHQAMLIVCDAKALAASDLVVARKHIADMLAAAKRRQPSLILLENIDGSAAGSGVPIALSTLLDAVKSLPQKEKVLLVATSGDANGASASVFRPYFDMTIRMESPDTDSRIRLIGRLLAATNMDPGLQMDEAMRQLAEHTSGLGYSDILLATNKVLLSALNNGRTMPCQYDIDAACENTGDATKGLSST